MIRQESIVQKGSRLLADGRVEVVEVFAHDVTANVRGDSGATHEVRHRRGMWTCSCPAFGRCAHRLAVQLIAPVGTRQRVSS